MRSALLKSALAALSLFLVGASDAGAAHREAPKHIVDAAQKAATAKPMKAGPVASRELLLAIAEHESGFLDDVVRCRRRGDGGLAHGAYQLHPEAFGGHKRAEVCENDELQARLALAVLRIAEGKGGLKRAVEIYASGRPRSTRASREILAIFRRRMAALR